MTSTRDDLNLVESVYEPAPRPPAANVEAVPELPPADWYADPFGRFERRYWDGSGWTEHVASVGRQAVDALLPAPVGQAPNVSINPAGWHPDPFGRHERRYWDGSAWTEHVASQDRPAVDTPTQHVPHQAAALMTEQLLVVNQKAKLVGKTLRYDIFDQEGQPLGTISEIRRDLVRKASDSYRRRTEASREYRLRVTDTNDRVLLTMTRPEARLRSHLIVQRPDGTTIGQITQESFGIAGGLAGLAKTGLQDVSGLAQGTIGGIKGHAAGQALGGVSRRLKAAADGIDETKGHARFGLEAGGQQIGSINAESGKQWDFNVKDPNGVEIAKITKTWAGWAKERFTKADNYVVQLHGPLGDPLRSLVIAAGIALDIALKQGDHTRGSSVWGTRRYE